MLSILDIIEDTVVDGPGFRTAIYAAGCSHACKGCHNPESWNIRNGKMMGIEEVLKRILFNPFADVTFTGGDPLFQIEGFTELAKAIKLHSSKNIWCYTGYRFEHVKGTSEGYELLKHIDVLVDGRFVQALCNESLLFRGSSNQRLIDVPASIQSGNVVLYEKTT